MAFHSGPIWERTDALRTIQGCSHFDCQILNPVSFLSFYSQALVPKRKSPASLLPAIGQVLSGVHHQVGISFPRVVFIVRDSQSHSQQHPVQCAASALCLHNLLLLDPAKRLQDIPAPHTVARYWPKPQFIIAAISPRRVHNSLVEGT